MSWSLRLVTPPASEPLTTDQARLHSRIDGGVDEDDLAVYITAARNYVEERIGRALLTQTWELGLPCFPGSDRIFLPRAPLQSVVSLSYTDAANVTRNLTAGTDFIVDQYAEPAELVLPYSKIWPASVLQSGRAVAIQFTAGYTSSALIPAGILLAMKHLVANWYENREAVAVGRTPAIVTELSFSVDALLATHKMRYAGPFRQ